jgi:hypothetical protein
MIGHDATTKEVKDYIDHIFGPECWSDMEPDMLEQKVEQARSRLKDAHYKSKATVRLHTALRLLSTREGRTSFRDAMARLDHQELQELMGLSETSISSN